jgi:hypothetical protein
MKKIFFAVLALAFLLSLPAIALATGDVTVSWTYSGTESDLAGFKIYRTQDTNNWPSAPLAEVADPAGIKYVDQGLEDGTYHYRVTAYDVNGTEGTPGEGSVTFDHPPGGTVTVTVTVTVNIP